MKRLDIISKLKQAGLELKEGAKHTNVFRGKHRISAVSRQKEIAEDVVRTIEKQTGVKLF